MKNLWIIIAIAGLILAVVLGSRIRRRAEISGSNLHSYALAPQFSLTGLDGSTVDLAQYRGKVVLLDFWATWCGPCRDEIPRFIQLQNRYGSQGLAVIGISMDDGPEPVRAFYRDFRINYPVAMGGAQLGEQYGGVLGLPIAFLIDRDGRIRAKHVGAVNLSALEKEIVSLLQIAAPSSADKKPEHLPEVASISRSGSNRSSCYPRA